MPIAKVHVMINTLTFFPLPAPTGIALQASRKVPVEVHLVSLLGQEQALQRKHRLMRLLLPPRPASAPCTLILNAIWASWPAILEHASLVRGRRAHQQAPQAMDGAPLAYRPMDYMKPTI